MKQRSIQEMFRVSAPYILLLAIFTFAVTVRMQAAERFFYQGKIIFSGNDAWYHYREVSHVVRNWPFTIRHDPWTGYPVGVSADQFGTLYDQIIGTVSLVIGLGNPSDRTVRHVLLVAPVIFGSISIFPTYLVTKKITDSKVTGVLSAAFLSLIPGTFLTRGLVGSSDHNIAEPFFMCVAVFALIVAQRYADDNAVVLESLRAGVTSENKRWLALSLGSGIALSLYLLTWPPGVLLVGILGIYYAVFSVVGFWQSEKTIEPPLLTGAVTSLPLLATMLVKYNPSVAPSATSYSIIQVFGALILLLECLFLVVLSRIVQRRNLGFDAFAMAVASSVVLSLATLRVVSYGIFRRVVGNFQRTFLLGQQSERLTIGEAQPLTADQSLWSGLYDQYGMLFAVSIIGFLALAYLAITRSSRSQNKLLILIWSLFIFLAGVTQARYNYYLAIPVSICGAAGVYYVFQFAGITSTKMVKEVEVYELIVVLLVLLLTLPGLVGAGGITAVNVASQTSPGGYVGWSDSLDWMSENAPDQGSLGNNSSQLGYYQDAPRGTGDYDYPNGTYGTLSWWDYGHWITTSGGQIPVANPFQQHAEQAANFLLAQNETEAMQAVNISDEDETIRFVMVDWKMVTPRSKFFAPVVFKDNVSGQDYYRAIGTRVDGQRGSVITLKTQKYYESLVTRLYHFHGSRRRASNVAVTIDSSGRRPVATGVRKFRTHQQAERFAQNSTARVGGIGNHPPEAVEALSHYRLVKIDRVPATLSPQYRSILRSEVRLGGDGVNVNDFVVLPGWTKTFERVPGARLKGNALPNSTVTAAVCMSPTTYGNATFTYYQQTTTSDSGEFNMTVPYSTTGYKNWGPEDGYTNSSVRASPKSPLFGCQREAGDGNKGYTITARNSTTRISTSVNVSEASVIGEGNRTVTVDFDS